MARRTAGVLVFRAEAVKAALPTLDEIAGSTVREVPEDATDAFGHPEKS